MWSAIDANRPVWLSRVGNGWDGLSASVVGCEAIEPAHVVDDVQLARVVGAEAGDVEGRVDQLPVPDGLGAIVLDPPDVAGGPVAVDVGPDQVGQVRAAVDPAAGERAGLAVGVLGGRRRDRVGARLALGVEDVAPLDEAPAVIGPLLDQVDLLPEVLAVLADPELARLAVVAEPPGVAQAIGPELGPGAGAIDEGVVLGHRVVPARVGMIDVDPQHGREQVVEGLAGQVGVGAAGTVARGDIEIAVVAEGQVAAVVAVGGPFDDDQLRFRVDAMWRLAVDRIAHRLSGLATSQRAIQADIDITVALVVGVERQADGQAIDLEQRPRPRSRPGRP